MVVEQVNLVNDHQPHQLGVGAVAALARDDVPFLGRGDDHLCASRTKRVGFLFVSFLLTLLNNTYTCVGAVAALARDDVPLLGRGDDHLCASRTKRFGVLFVSFLLTLLTYTHV